MELTGDDLVGEVNGENSVQSCEEVPELREDDSAESTEGDSAEPSVDPTADTSPRSSESSVEAFQDDD